MKTIRSINTISFMIPLCIAAIELIISQGVFLAIIATMATGFLQTIAAVLFAMRKPGSWYIWIYFFFYAVFFILLTTTDTDGIWFMPPVLFLYLSFIIYTDSGETENATSSETFQN
ncbi:hypothetical protein [Flavobacterium pallidum]|uniref:Uncharacterized protein n=1 Tax=Flavobacterium pallidum TaxID=2172098 RepID=A0A2S1SGT8_9FLAO|nr:hypothetical protein [Flavobacterium pallidum]AWI25595.1 hypothetical protein HYN49_06615 [Flavobacterium pallidum]